MTRICTYYHRIELVARIRYAGAVAAILTTLLAGCQPVDSPYRPVIVRGATIRGEASVSCTVRVDTSLASLYLERRAGDGSWEVMDQDDSSEIPYPKPVRLFVLDACRPGTWRLRYYAKATYTSKVGATGNGSSFLAVRTDKDCNIPR